MFKMDVWTFWSQSSSTKKSEIRGYGTILYIAPPSPQEKYRYFFLNQQIQSYNKIVSDRSMIV